MAGCGGRSELCPPPGDRQEPARSSGLYDFVFDHRGRRSSSLVEGLISSPSPLPAQAERHRAAAPDPRQQPARDHLDGHPDGHRRGPVRASLADAQHGRRGRRQPDIQVTGRRAPSSSGRSSTWSADGQTVLFEQLDGPEMTVPAGKTDPPRPPARRTSSTRSTSRSSCSSATSCPGGQHVRLHGRSGRRRPDVPRPVRGAVRDRPRLDAVRRSRRSARPTTTPGWRKQIAKAQGDARRRRRRAAAAGQVQLDLAAKDVAYRQDDASRRRPTSRSRSSSRTMTPASHNVAIHDAAGQEVFKGDIFTGVDAGPTRSRPSRPAPTRSPARSTRAMTGTLTVQ